ncbi:MAG: hypothetical protein KTR32_27835, partial [Granulosicoccus sp.]|nr:hypothetical protein [Granulosicoccus sp.]
MGKLAPLCQNVAALVLVCGFGVAVYSSTYASGPETVTDAPAEKALCSREFIASMCTPANSLDAEVQLNCSVDFKVMDCQMAAGRPNVISKRLRLAGASASNLVVDLAGALIDSGSGTYNHRRGDIVEVASVPLGNNEWSVPRNTMFRNAKIEGSLRVYGLGKNGEAARVKASSYNETHIEYVRKNAPSDITLESLDIKGYGRTPVYFSPGV